MATEVAELPRISIKSTVARAEPRPFVGRIVSDALQPSKFDVENKPYRWVLAVEPKRNLAGTGGFQLGGKTGAFWEYLAIPKEVLEGEPASEQSKYGRHLQAFQKVFGTDDDRTIGRSEYLDEYAWWIRDTVTYGTNKQTGEPITSTVLLPQRKLTPEEMVEYGLAAGSSAAPEGMTFTEEELATLATALDGADRGSLQKRAHQKRVGPKLIQGVGKGNGPAVEALIAQGFGSFEGDTFQAAA